MKKTITLLVLALALLGGTACRATKTAVAPELTSSDEALFKEGESYLKKDPERARLFFRQVIDSFPKSFYAQRAKLAIADSFYNDGDEGNMLLAASEYREFISLYPYSPSASYAQYKIAVSFFDKTLKPGRDQAKTIQALAEFKKMLSLYPLAEEAKAAREKIAECEERLAEHTFTIGYYYFRNAAYKAGISRLTEILTNYPLYSGMDKVYYYLGESNFLMQRPDQSVPFFTKLVSDYPKSELAKKSQARLKEISAMPKPKPVPEKK
jgi:outer membrane protein assembly factor BamD